jgi:hypothetical protein
VERAVHPRRAPAAMDRGGEDPDYSSWWGGLRMTSTGILATSMSSTWSSVATVSSTWLWRGGHTDDKLHRECSHAHGGSWRERERGVRACFWDKAATSG